jgi:protein-disulfide isomerase
VAHDRRILGRVAAGLAAACLTATGALAGRGEASPAGPAAVPGAAAVAALFRGIPQDGPWLGRKTAPIVLVEYVDVQCPFCAQFSTTVMPTVVRRYVRTGRVRILFRGLAFLGPDSLTGLRWIDGAGRQDRLWNVLELMFAGQGRENSGWVTPERLRAVAASVKGLDLARLRRDSAGPAVSAQIQAAALAARRAHVPGTPYFEAGGALAALKPVAVNSFAPGDFARQLDALLER